MAETVHDPIAAATAYRTALTLDSDAVSIAFRAYRAGIDAGDRALALKAVQALDRLDVMPPDARLLVYVAAIRDRDWTTAARTITQIGRDSSFSFAAPLLAAWLPDAMKAVPRGGPTAYTIENDALAAVARGDTASPLLTIRTLWPADPARARAVRLAAAAALVARGQAATAATLLSGDDTAILTARALVLRGKHLGGVVDTPERGAAFLFARIADDLPKTETPRAALTFARLATFAAPDSPYAALALARALDAAQRSAEALAVVDRLRDLVFARLAGELRPALLEHAGRQDEALAEIDPTSLRALIAAGGLELRRGRPAAAFVRYRAALALAGDGRASWQLLLAAARAAELAQDWASARPLLEQAVQAAPQEAMLLNQLGFGLVVHGTELPRAIALLERANALKPGDAAITDSLGWARFRMGELPRAVALLEAARQLDGANAEIGEHLGDAYWTAGRRVEARYAWTAAREAADDGTRPRLAERIDRGLP